MTLLPLAFLAVVCFIGWYASTHRGRLSAWMDRHDMLRCEKTYFRLHGRYGRRLQCEMPRGHRGFHGKWDGRPVVKSTATGESDG